MFLFPILDRLRARVYRPIIWGKEKKKERVSRDTYTRAKPKSGKLRVTSVTNVTAPFHGTSLAPFPPNPSLPPPATALISIGSYFQIQEQYSSVNCSISLAYLLILPQWNARNSGLQSGRARAARETARCAPGLRIFRWINRIVVPRIRAHLLVCVWACERVCARARANTKIQRAGIRG